MAVQLRVARPLRDGTEHMFDLANAEDDYCYLTTRGRVSGQPHEIEIWFTADDDTLYMLAGAGDRSDWVRNLRAEPAVTVRGARHDLRRDRARDPGPHRSAAGAHTRVREVPTAQPGKPRRLARVRAPGRVRSHTVRS